MSAPPQTLEAIRVSPLIKTARWSLLLLGIWYGSTRWNYLHRKEEKYRAHLLETKPMRDAQEAERKRLETEAQSRDLRAQGLDLGF